MASDLRNIVVVGFGLTGVEAVGPLAKQLPSTHRIVAIDAGPAAFYPPASLRASVVPGWETKATIDFDQYFPKDSRHVVLPNTRVTKLSSNSVTIDKPSKGFTNEIPFDYCIIATGSAYSFPSRPSEKYKTLQDVVDGFKKLQKQVEAAKSILIIGGGAVGVEFAGEVSSQYPDKKITLVDAGSRLLEASAGIGPKVSSDLDSQLTRRGVKIVYNAKADISGLQTGSLDSMRSFELSNGEQVEADFVLLAFGNRPTTSFVKDSFGEDAVNAKGQIKVRPTFQLASQDRIFAIGDVTDINELKTVAAGKYHGPVVAANIVSLLSNTKASSLKSYKAASPLMVVSLGPNGGAGQLFGFKVGSFLTSNIKSKTLFVKNFESSFHGP